jgi:hypothetical protein
MMSTSDDSPQLVQWGNPGQVPGSVKREIERAEIEDKLRRSPVGVGTYVLREDEPFPVELDVFKVPKGGSLRGVELVARQVLDELRAKKQLSDHGKEKMGAISWRAYALLAWCTEQKEVAPPVLMRLLFECLALSEGRPHKEICELHNWPHLMKANLSDYDRAVFADAQAIISGQPELQNKPLAKIAGVTPSTIRSWRQTAHYERRRNAALYNLRLKQQQDGAGEE